MGHGACHVGCDMTDTHSPDGINAMAGDKRQSYSSATHISDLQKHSTFMDQLHLICVISNVHLKTITTTMLPHNPVLNFNDSSLLSTNMVCSIKCSRNCNANN